MPSPQLPLDAAGFRRQVERSFGKTLRALNLQQKGLGVDREFDIVKVILDYKKEDEAKVVLKAQEVWSQNFGAARSWRSTKRRDYGSKHKISIKEGSELKWIRDRREQVATKANACAPDTDDIDVGEYWLKEHEKELVFQEKKRRTKYHEAVKQGVADGSDVAEELQAVAQEQAKKDKERMRSQELAQRRITPGTPLTVEQLGERVVYVDGSLKQREAVMTWLRERRITRTEFRSRAQVFVVASPSSPSARVQWVAMLVGGYVMNPDLLLTGSGVAISYKAALKLRRQIWMTPRFREKHAGIALCITEAKKRFGTAGKKFKILKGDSPDTYMEARAKVPAKRRNEVIALMVAGEELHTYSP